MKKFFLFTLGVLVFSASSAITWKALSEQPKFSALIKGNVIALAQNEDDGYSCTKRGENLFGTPYVECDGRRTTC